MSIAVPTARTLAAASGAALLLLGCTPTLDWREVRPPGSGMVALFPCRPGGLERRLALAGQTERLTLYTCSAGDLTWGLAVVDVGDAARRAVVMDALHAAAAANIGTAEIAAGPLTVPGAWPHRSSGLTRLTGRRPDGQVVHMHMAVFTRGTRVFQATVLGADLPDDAVQTFFASLRMAP